LSRTDGASKKKRTVRGTAKYLEEESQRGWGGTQRASVVLKDQNVTQRNWKKKVATQQNKKFWTAKKKRFATS